MTHQVGQTTIYLQFGSTFRARFVWEFKTFSDVCEKPTGFFGIFLTSSTEINQVNKLVAFALRYEA